MLRVALTGGVGSGKSTAAAIFRELGCFVSQSDEVARTMMQPGEAVYRSIVRQFGPEVLRADGTLDRTVLARLAFTEGRSDDLNRIVHPPVIARQAEWMRSVGRQNPDAVAMVESALIFETKYSETNDSDSEPGSAAEVSEHWRTRFDHIILVTAPEAVRIDRYITRAGASSTEERAAAEADARSRMRVQIADRDKLALADTVIANSGSLDDLRQRVTQVWQELCAIVGCLPAKTRT